MLSVFQPAHIYTSNASTCATCGFFFPAACRKKRALVDRSARHRPVAGPEFAVHVVGHCSHRLWPFRPHTTRAVARSFVAAAHSSAVSLQRIIDGALVQHPIASRVGDPHLGIDEARAASLGAARAARRTVRHATTERSDALRARRRVRRRVLSSTGSARGVGRHRGVAVRVPGPPVDAFGVLEPAGARHVIAYRYAMASAGASKSSRNHRLAFSCGARARGRAGVGAGVGAGVNAGGSAAALFTTLDRDGGVV